MAVRMMRSKLVSDDGSGSGDGQWREEKKNDLDFFWEQIRCFQPNFLLRVIKLVGSNYAIRCNIKIPTAFRYMGSYVGDCDSSR